MANNKLEDILRSDPFYSPDTQLDLSQFPHLTPLSDASFEDDRFAPLDRSGSGHGSQDLKQFLADQTVDRRPSVVHAAGAQFKVFFSDSLWRAEGTVNGQRHRYTANDRDGLLSKLATIPKPNPFRKLTEEQELQVIRLAQSGDRLTAIGTYLRFAIGDARAAQYDSPVEMMGDPKLIPVMDDCCNFCWYHANPHAIDTPDWHEYKNHVLAGRPATFQLLDAIWLRYQDHIETQPQQPEEPMPDPDIPGELNDLDDGEVDQLMLATKREFARAVKAGRL